jgi:hypothetical protein
MLTASCEIRPQAGAVTYRSRFESAPRLLESAARPLESAAGVMGKGQGKRRRGRELIMKARTFIGNALTCAALAFGVLLVEPARAQTDRPGPGGSGVLPWENSRVRLTRVSAEPGATLPAGGNQVLVYLTADPDGRMPAEAVWQASGTGDARNRGRVRLEALAIALKDLPPGAPSPHAARRVQRSGWSGCFRSYRQPARARGEAPIQRVHEHWSATRAS